MRDKPPPEMPEEQILLTPLGCRRINAVMSQAVDRIRESGVLAQTRDRMCAAIKRNEPDARDHWKKAESRDAEKLVAQLGLGIREFGGATTLTAATLNCVMEAKNKILNDLWTEARAKGLDGRESDRAFGGRAMSAFRQAMTTVPVEIATGLPRERVSRLFKARDVARDLAKKPKPVGPNDIIAEFVKRHAEKYDNIDDEDFQNELIADLERYTDLLRGVPSNGGVGGEIPGGERQSGLLDAVAISSPRFASERGYAEAEVSVLLWTQLEEDCLPQLEAKASSWRQAIERYLNPHGKRKAGVEPEDEKWKPLFDKAIIALRACIEDAMHIKIIRED